MPDEKEEKSNRKSSVCGHENKHFIPALLNGKPVQEPKLTCTLEKDHSGDHSAPYKTVDNGALVDALASWSDGAGVPV